MTQIFNGKINCLPKGLKISIHLSTYFKFRVKVIDITTDNTVFVTCKSSLVIQS